MLESLDLPDNDVSEVRFAIQYMCLKALSLLDGVVYILI